MVCEAFESQLALAAGGDLAAAEVEALERHLRSCENCRRFAAELQESQLAVRMLAEPSVDDRILADIRAGVLHEIERTQSRRLIGWPLGARSTFGARSWLAAAAGLLVVLGAVLIFESRDIRPTPPADVTARLPEPAPLPAPVPAPSTEASTPPTADADQQLREAVPEPAPPPPALVPIVPDPEPSIVQTAALTPRPELAPPQRAPLQRAADASTTAEPTVIKLISEEADLVIYWLVHPPETTTKETTDAISSI